MTCCSLTALIQAIIRFIIMIVMTLLFFQRVDSPMLPAPVSFLDKGYKSWLSAVAIDAKMNRWWRHLTGVTWHVTSWLTLYSPIVLTFVRLLVATLPHKYVSTLYEQQNIVVVAQNLRKKVPKWRKPFKKFLPWGSSKQRTPSHLEMVTSDTIERKRARTRWYLAYLLIKNPSLVELRKSALEEKARVKFEYALRR